MHTKIMDRPTYTIREETARPVALQDPLEIENARGRTP
jgi:hypothetical protein